MSQQGKGSLLLPLGIGAGLLLLLTGMKKKEAVAPAATAAPDDASALLPAVSTAASSVPQIEPTPAPSYTQAVAKTAASEDDEESGGGEEKQEAEDPQEETASSGDDGEEGGGQEDEGNASPSYASKSSGGSYTPYSPASSINTNRQTTPLPAPAYTQTASSQASITNRKSIRFQSDQAKQLALQKASNNKSIRFQSDQAKKFAARSGTANTNALFIGKGKPRMGVRLPVTNRPGAAAVTAATTATMPAVSVTSQPAATPAAQATIFPLKFGTTSPYVKEVQRRLGVSATGYFGTMTRTALQKRFRVSEVSESLYKQIITGKAQVMPVRRPVVKPSAKPVHRLKKPLPKHPKTIRRK